MNLPCSWCGHDADYHNYAEPPPVAWVWVSCSLGCGLVAGILQEGSQCPAFPAGLAEAAPHVNTGLTAPARCIGSGSLFPAQPGDGASQRAAAQVAELDAGTLFTLEELDRR